MIAFYDTFMYAMYGIFVIVAAAGIANSVLLSVQDRTRDFATLRAVAFTSGWVKAIVVIETLIVGGAASLAAIGASALFVAAIGPEGIRISESVRGIAEWMPETIPARTDAGALVLVFLGGCISPLAAAIYPLNVLGKMNVREALGYI
jgi:ABC-type antimicrobial peptide transport system permease subunit